MKDETRKPSRMIAMDNVNLDEQDHEIQYIEWMEIQVYEFDEEIKSLEKLF